MLFLSPLKSSRFENHMKLDLPAAATSLLPCSQGVIRIPLTSRVIDQLTFECLQTVNMVYTCIIVSARARCRLSRSGLVVEPAHYGFFRFWELEPATDSAEQHDRGISIQGYHAPLETLPPQKVKDYGRIRKD